MGVCVHICLMIALLNSLGSEKLVYVMKTTPPLLKIGHCRFLPEPPGRIFPCLITAGNKLDNNSRINVECDKTFTERKELHLNREKDRRILKE